MGSALALQKRPLSEAPPTHGAAADAAVRRAAIREWLEAIRARHNVTPRDIATRARVNLSTIYRMLSADSPHVPQLDSILKIAQAFGVAMPDAGLPGETRDIAPQGFGEGDAAPYSGEAPAVFGALGANRSVWRVGSRALELQGVLPDDLLLLDQAAPARAGDCVVAQIYDFDAATARTRIRAYDGLYLTTATMDRALQERPLPVDGERVVVMGRIVGLFRNLA